MHKPKFISEDLLKFLLSDKKELDEGNTAVDISDLDSEEIKKSPKKRWDRIKSVLDGISSKSVESLAKK